METFNVNISVNDCCVSKCRTSSNSTTTILTSTSDFISIQCCFYLKIIAVHNNYIVFSLDNNSIFFVRKAFVGIPIKICISNKCSSHIVTILVNSITE